MRSFHAAVHPCLARVLTEKHCSFLQDRMIVVLLFSECGTSRNAVTVKSRFCLIRTLSTLPSFTRVCQRSLPLAATIAPFVFGRLPAMTSTHWYAAVTKSTYCNIVFNFILCLGNVHSLCFLHLLDLLPILIRLNLIGVVTAGSCYKSWTVTRRTSTA